MRVKKNKNIQDDADLQMTPMIDIVFQLLIFFLLSAKFVALEGQLSSYLPKDRGLDQEPPPELQLSMVGLYLQWNDEGPGAVRCLTFQYVDPADGNRRSQFEFRRVPAGERVPFGPLGDTTVYEYDTPDFAELERYIDYRHRTFEDTQGLGKGLPVTVNFDDKVPMQMIVNILDLCTRVGITDFTLAGKEVEP